MAGWPASSKATGAAPTPSTQQSFPWCWSAWAAPSSLAASAWPSLVPLAIASGVAAARREGGIFDRVLSTVSLAVGALPEFVTGVFLILVFGIWLAVLPIQALPPKAPARSP